MRRLTNFIGGESVAPKSGQYVELINPATGQPFAEMPVSNAADVDAAVQVAAKAFTTWRRTTPSERSTALLKMGGTHQYSVFMAQGPRARGQGLELNGQDG